MAIMEIIGLSKDFGGTPVLTDVSLVIEPGEKAALVGRNGCGKTTLLRIAMGLDDDYKGVVRTAPGARLAYVRQKAPDFKPGESAAAYVCRDALERRAELDRLAETMAGDDGRAAAEALARYAALREAYDDDGGDEAEEAADRLLHKAGLGHRADAPAETLSGGEKNVLALVRAVRRMPDLLVLDEPGNHLDMAGLAWLEDFIATLPCAVLLVSHDRRMLDKVAASVLELEGGRVARYSGNYSAYRLERLKQAAGQGQDWQADRKRIERLEALVRRFADIARSRPDPAWGKRLRAKRSQLERVKAEATERPDLGNRDARVSFLGEASKADLALRVEGYSKAYGDRVILEPSGFTVMNGERVALVGPNGSGKTSLVRDIVELGSWDDGRLRVGPSMVVGYCAQAQEVFDPGRTVEEEFLKILPTRKDALAHLGRFLFSWDDLGKRVSSLSGGELNRLQLARASAMRANFLILDEPTNHLDIPTREAVEDALADFDGTVLVVSHDRYFIEKVAERIVFIDGRRLVEYEGGFAEYWRDVGSAGAAAGRRPVARGLEGRGRATVAGGPARGAARGAGVSDGLESRIEAMEREKERLERASAAAFDERDFKKAKAVAAELERHNAVLQKLWAEYVG
ncbi:MAG TPA: ABC-F family ATP-binding cassette domain-containing protein [Spirochaetia bacterium]|nr:ABC-F family ATP-binding cassette domain-containing protein [Spirochaetales bacterium]HRW23014.1 ABC-F family ATP-binding cassette domain-containing protein [Spirochaetia bacterium]